MSLQRSVPLEPCRYTPWFVSLLGISPKSKHNFKYMGRLYLPQPCDYGTPMAMQFICQRCGLTVDDTRLAMWGFEKEGK